MEIQNLTSLQEEAMISTLHLSFLTLLVLESILAITVNAVIVMVNAVDWVKRRHLGSCDMILMSVGSLRLFVHCSTIIQALFRTFSYDFQKIYKFFLIAHVFVNYSSLWMATLLCVFYCLRIANYSHPLFLRLRSRISGLVPRQILGSFASPFSFCIAIALNKFIVYKSNSSESISPNNVLFVTEKLPHVPYVYLTFCSVPLAIFCFATFLLIRSIWVHTRQMKNNSTSFRNPSLSAHFTAVKSMGSFFILHVIDVVIRNFAYSGMIPAGSPWGIFLAILNSTCPFLHSVILILCNVKLRQTSSRILCCVKKCAAYNGSLNPNPGHTTETNIAL